MATRAALRSILLTLLGTESDDPMYPSATLNPILQQSVDALLTAIIDTNPAYLSKTATLQPDGGSGHIYSLDAQAVAIEDFARWLELRYDDEDGALLTHAPRDRHTLMGPGYFDVLGEDDIAEVITSPESDEGPLFFRYGYWPVEMPDDNAEPGGIPKRFHDVIPLEALFAFELGGESVRPRTLNERWRDRRAELIRHVGRRGPGPTKSQLDPAKLADAL